MHTLHMDCVNDAQASKANEWSKVPPAVTTGPGGQASTPSSRNHPRHKPSQRLPSVDPNPQRLSLHAKSRPKNTPPPPRRLPRSFKRRSSRPLLAHRRRIYAVPRPRRATRCCPFFATHALRLVKHGLARYVVRDRHAVVQLLGSQRQVQVDENLLDHLRLGYQPDRLASRRAPRTRKRVDAHAMLHQRGPVDVRCACPSSELVVRRRRVFTGAGGSGRSRRAFAKGVREGRSVCAAGSASRLS